MPPARPTSPGNAGAECRPAAGPCDVAEFCTGTECETALPTPQATRGRCAVPRRETAMRPKAAPGRAAIALRTPSCLPRSSAGRRADSAETRRGLLGERPSVPPNQATCPTERRATTGNACTRSSDCAGGICRGTSFEPEGTPVRRRERVHGSSACSSGTLSWCLLRDVGERGSLRHVALREDGRILCWGSDYYGQVSSPNGSTEVYTS